MKLRIVTLSYNTEGKGTGGASGPVALLRAGLSERLNEGGHTVLQPWAVQLKLEEESQYGGWNRVAVANGHLSKLIASARDEGSFVLALLADCNGILGVLGGLQRGEQMSCPSAGCVGLAGPADSGKAPTRPCRVGFVYVDAHGDYNTPDTSPSGMLGGMPVAVAAGKCLPRLRRRSGMLAPICHGDILLAGMRDLDDLERDAISEDELAVVRETDLQGRSRALNEALQRLSCNVEVLCVHVDLDILDPAVAPAAGLPSSGGLTGEELGQALSFMLADEKVGVLSVASYRADKDQEGGTLEQVMRALLLAIGEAKVK